MKITQTQKFTVGDTSMKMTLKCFQIPEKERGIVARMEIRAGSKETKAI